VESENRQPPYLRIVGDIKDRITAGEFGPGEPVPSTRALVKEQHVAMATAAKALATLREQGWVYTVPGGATRVRDRSAVRAPASAHARPNPEPSSDSVVRAGIDVADAHGVGGLSMRRLAMEVGIGVMSLYHYVPDKAALLRRMADTAFGEEQLPEPGPEGWRAKLELSARLQWRSYRRHPWLVSIMHNSLTHPPAIASGMRFVDWELRALRGSGLEPRAALHTVLALDGYVGGIAASNALEVEAETDTGISATERMAADRPLHDELFGRETFPDLTAALESGATALADVDEIFEWGLQQQLDGIGARLCGA